MVRRHVFTLCAVLGLAIASSLVSGCDVSLDVSFGEPTAAPSATETAPAPEPTTEPQVTPADPSTPDPGPGPRELFTTAVQNLSEAQSYQFAVEATHETSMGERRYHGEGAVAAPDQFRSQLEGPADVMLIVVHDGPSRYCADTRGPLGECPVGWGGPVSGAAPYIALLYPMHLDGLTQEPDTADELRFRFAPALAEVAARGDEYAQALADVEHVTGELVIDRHTLLPKLETLQVQQRRPNGDTETVHVQIRFSHYDEPVEIELPSTARR